MSERLFYPPKKSLLALAGAGLIASSGLWFLSSNESPQTHTDPSNAGPQHSALTEATVDQTARFHGVAAEPEKPASVETFRTPANLGNTPFASSLGGTDIDGQLRTDTTGNLVVDLQTKDFFDYFLNTVGEVDAAAALGEIERLAHSSLPESAAVEAMALLEQYLDYKQKVLALGSARLDSTRQQDPTYQFSVFRQALNDLKQLRGSTFSPDTHQAFFGLEEAYGEYTLATLALQQRTDLSAQARETLQLWHRQQLPNVIRQTETRLLAEEDINAQRQTVLANSSSPTDTGEQLRMLGMASDQADEVVTYLSERKQFQGTFDQYQAELTQLQQAGLAADDLAARKKELLESHFDNEQTRTWARLKSLDTPSQ